MDIEAVAVLSLAVLISLALLAYVYLFLPSQLERRLRETTKAFSLAVELRFPSHRGVTEVVVRRARLMGEQLGLSGKRLANLEIAAQLRDIGLCSIPYSLVNQRPMSEWTAAERVVYESHPDVSASMLELIPSLKNLAAIVRSHHVHFDGSSGGLYPSGTNIPIESRILKVLTDFTWIEQTSGSAEAYAQMTALSGKSFDPMVVEAFLRVLTSEGAGELHRAIA